jgi:hypothetical protein
MKAFVVFPRINAEGALILIKNNNTSKTVTTLYDLLKFAISNKNMRHEWGPMA